MARENNFFPPAFYFVASALLLTAAWLMPAFPILIFFGLAPLFALTDRVNNTSGILERMEWIVFALVVNFMAASSFDFSRTATSMLYAILFTLPFIGQVWLKQVLGNRVGKITVILFWLSLEYVLLKINPQHSIYLADALNSKREWTGWSEGSGYLGGSLWILIVNLVAYLALFSKTALKWHWMLLTLALLISPVIYGYFQSPGLTRTDMLNLYEANAQTGNVTYLARGEFVVRTATWVSTLIILFTFVKSQTARR
jgi:apolipoprotein N-acyltransferase